MEKKVIFSFLGIILLLLNTVFAINLDISVKPVSDTFITEFNQPAVFDLIIKNNGDSDIFQIYSLVGVDISPDNVKIEHGETKIITINTTPRGILKDQKGYLTFEYIVKDSKENFQKERLSMNIVDLSNSFSISAANLNPSSEKASVLFRNIVMHDFENINVKMSSTFFNFETNFPLKFLEEKNIEIPIDKEKLKTLNAGNYIINVQISYNGKVGEKDVTLKFLEQENIESSENTEGLIIRRTEFAKNNIGNTKKIVKISVEKNLIAYLFTTVSVSPTKTQLQGFKKSYYWEKELSPGEQLKVVVKTNWLYPLLIVILIIALFLLIKRFVETDIMLRKKIYYVKTKGGEFALKVHLVVKAKKFVERIKITDKIPSLVSLYDKFGAISPDKVDLINKRLEWNIESLNPGEERIFSYIIYSKIGVVGRFELPAAKAVYEKDGKLKNTTSNRSFFINKPKSKPQ